MSRQPLGKQDRYLIQCILTFLPLISLMEVHKRGTPHRTKINKERLRLIFSLVVRKSVSICFIEASRYTYSKAVTAVKEKEHSRLIMFMLRPAIIDAQKIIHSMEV